MKKITSLILALALVISLVPVPTSAQDGGQSIDSNVSIEGSNSFGNLLANTVNDSQEGSEQNYDGKITDLFVDGTTATVEYSTPVSANLVVAVYTEDGSTMLGSGVAAVTPEQTVALVEIEISQMPSTVLAGAYLLETGSNAPLSQALKLNLQTDAQIVDSGKCGDNLTWTLSSNGVLTICGSGPMYDYAGPMYDNDYTYAPWYKQRDNVVRVLIGSGVTSIGSCTFSDCSDLNSVIIPEGVLTIGSQAFYCCEGLTNVSIPDSVTSIGFGAFQSCTGLTNVTIPDSITSIGQLTFYGCAGLTSITIPDRVTSIESSAFQYCTSLTDITIPNSVTHIDPYVFWGCTSLTSITIPDGMTSISWDVFRGCTGLTNITIPDGVTSIGDGAFYDCTSLSNVYYGGTVEQWNGIDICDRNIGLIHSTIHCTDGDILPEKVGDGPCGENLTWALSDTGTL